MAQTGNDCNPVSMSDLIISAVKNCQSLADILPRLSKAPDPAPWGALSIHLFMSALRFRSDAFGCCFAYELLRLISPS